MVKDRLHRSFIVVAALAVMACAWVLYSRTPTGEDSGLPTYIGWSNTGPGTMTYELGTWFSNELKRRYDIVLHNRPFSEDTQNIWMMTTGRVDYSITGIRGSYFAQEGLFDFAAVGQGPQPIRLILQNHSAHLRTLLVRKDSGITSIQGLRGKRIAWTQVTPDVGYFILSLLRYGGLSASDVVLVPVGGPEDAIRALIAKKADAAFSPSRERELYKVASPEFPLRYLPMPKGNGDWKAVQALAPFFKPVSGKYGAGLSPKAPVESAASPFPVIVTRANIGTDYAEKFTRALSKASQGIINQYPFMDGWNAEFLPTDWQVPFHDGSIAVFKEQGKWTPAHQRYNDRLVERQRVLAEAWKRLLAEHQPKDDQELRALWFPAREKALHAAGFESWFLDSKDAMALYTTNK